MHAHMPPFTKPTGAYDASRLTAREAYDQTSAIAAKQDAKLALTDEERNAKLRTMAHYIYHAKLLMDEVFAESRARSCELLDERASEARTMGLYADAGTPRKTASADLTPRWSPQWLAEQGIPAESSYIASFNLDGSRIATTGEIDGIRQSLPIEHLRAYGIGDVPHTAATQHPMAAEVLRDHDERLHGPEDQL